MAENSISLVLVVPVGRSLGVCGPGVLMGFLRPLQRMGLDWAHGGSWGLGVSPGPSRAVSSGTNAGFLAAWRLVRAAGRGHGQGSRVDAAAPVSQQRPRRLV